MSFVTTHPAALTAAAGTLAGIGSAMAAHNLATAAPTTGVIPAAADPVSALQATQFSAYGMLYQQISTQADAIHQTVVTTLGANAASYGSTEVTNAIDATPAAVGSSGLLGMLTGQNGMLSSGMSGVAIMGINQISNFASATSDLTGLDAAGFLTGDVAPYETVETDDAVLAGATGPAGPTGAVGAAPVTASAGQASAAGRLSVPPSWGTSATAVPNPAGALTGAVRASAATAELPLMGVPAGLPAAAGDHGGSVAGPAKYGVKPNLTPRPPAL